MFKANNKDTRTTPPMATLEKAVHMLLLLPWRRSGIFILKIQECLCV